VSVTTIYEIIESAIITGDKIRIALHPVEITHSDGKTASQREYINLYLVFQRIQVIRAQFEGLPEIQRADFF